MIEIMRQSNVGVIKRAAERKWNEKTLWLFSVNK